MREILSQTKNKYFLNGDCSEKKQSLGNLYDGNEKSERVLCLESIDCLRNTGIWSVFLDRKKTLQILQNIYRKKI